MVWPPSARRELRNLLRACDRRRSPVLIRWPTRIAPCLIRGQSVRFGTDNVTNRAVQKLTSRFGCPPPSSLVRDRANQINFKHVQPCNTQTVFTFDGFGTRESCDVEKRLDSVWVQVALSHTALFSQQFVLRSGARWTGLDEIKFELTNPLRECLYIVYFEAVGDGRLRASSPDSQMQSDLKTT